MRLRYALPLLSASAVFMAVGLMLALGFRPATAAAQQGETATPGIRPITGTSARGSSMSTPRTNVTEGTELQEFEVGTEYQPVPGNTRVTFNLEDADLPDLVRLVSNLTGRRFILPGKVRSIKATVFAPTKVTVREAYNAFLSILEVNGLTVVPAGRYLKIAETANIERQTIPLNTGDASTASSDRFQTRLHRLNSVSAEDAATLLNRFKSQAGSVTAYAPTNTLIITDTGRQIRRMLRVVETIDVPRTGEQIWIEEIHYAAAPDVAARLQEIFGSQSGGSSSSSAMTTSRRPSRARAQASASSAMTGAAAATGPTTVGSARGESRITNIIADERTNSLIIMATERAYLRMLELIRRLDVPVEGEGRVHVHYVQNGDAEEIASTLSALMGGGGGRSPTRAGSTARAATPQSGAAASAGPSVANLGENVSITTHKPTNALVITASFQEFAAIRRVIQQLDQPRRQVFVEAVVMELNVDRSNTLGFSFHGGVPDTGVDGALSILGFNAATSIGFPLSQDALTGLALGVRGPELEGLEGTGLSIPGFGVVLNALASSGDANVLSTPHIIAMDNTQAEINIGQNVPLQTNGLAGGLGSLGSLAGLAGGSQSGAASGLAGLAGLAGGGLGGLGGGVQRQDVGTIIRLTPHINEQGEIRMEIEEEISEVGAAQGDLGVVPINRRTAKTVVMVRDQQTVVIGGLTRESVTRSESKIPILGDIPLIGALFRRTTTTRQKNNLLLFMTPYIIRDMSDLRAIYERKMRERQEFLDRYFVFGDQDYEAPVDFSRTRGLVHEIITTLDELDEEAAIAEAAEAEPPPEHVPRPPVGAMDPYDPEEDLGDGDVLIEPDGGELTPATIINEGPTPTQVQVEQEAIETSP